MEAFKTLIWIINIISALAVIVLVLLQHGKGRMPAQRSVPAAVARKAYSVLPVMPTSSAAQLPLPQHFSLRPAWRWCIFTPTPVSTV